MTMKPNRGDREHEKFVETALGDTAVRVQVAEDLSSAGVVSGFFTEASTVTTPGLSQTLISFTVPAATNRQLSQVLAAVRVEGKLEVFVNSNLVGSGRSGPASPNIFFSWLPALPVVTGDLVEVKF